MSVTGKREGGAAQRRKLMRETYPDRAQRVCGPAGPAGQGGGLRRGSRLVWVSWVGWVRPRREIKWKFNFEFQMNLDFGRTLRNFTRRFRRNLDMRIFSKFL
jgi:hypothetical protein